jgi:acetyl-CoA acetyltransferase family protein
VLNTNQNVVLVDFARSAFVRLDSEFFDSSAQEIFDRVVDALIVKTGLNPEAVDSIFCGSYYSTPKNTNIARNSVLNLGLPPRINTKTVNTTCSSGIQAVIDSVVNIHCGFSTVAIAGGVDCAKIEKKVRSNFFRKSKFDSLFLPELNLVDSRACQSLEKSTRYYGISRKDQDEYTYNSHVKAQKYAQICDSIAPIWLAPTYEEFVEKDSLILDESALKKMRNSRAILGEKNSSITITNSASLCDGAGTVLLMEQNKAKELGFEAKILIKDFCWLCCKNRGNDQFFGASASIPTLLERNDLKLENVDLFEIHESSAAQILCEISMMEYLGQDKLNVNGGTLSFGHSFGATGIRLLMMLSEELCRREKKLGVLSIGTIDGSGVSVLIERIG